MIGEIYYTDEVIRDVLLNGIVDLGIRCDVLSTEDIQSKPTTDTIAFLVKRETARNANQTSAVSALLEYVRSNRDCLIQQKQRVQSYAKSALRLTNRRLHLPSEFQETPWMEQKPQDMLRELLEKEASVVQANYNHSENI